MSAVPRGGGLLWGGFTLPGSAWMIVFFLVPFYAVAAVAFGRIDPIFGTASPEWNPLQWDFTVASNTLDEVFTGPLRTVYLRTFLYVGLALAMCVVIGYPVAYVSRGPAAPRASSSCCSSSRSGSTTCCGCSPGSGCSSPRDG